jgi:hypothetical protein
LVGDQGLAEQAGGSLDSGLARLDELYPLRHALGSRGR